MIPAYVKIIRNIIARNTNEFLQVSILFKLDKRDTYSLINYYLLRWII